MNSKLKWRNDGYYCANCFMVQQPPIDDFCWFCGAIFTNYEQVMQEAVIFNEENVSI